ncbi:ribosome maturation factor RimM [Candidatus Cetobacterium colombiensis]|jgi:16S rRNA processing protein RimM|uniref:Ribosome maturation factor RimM n=1 Tax=Candidatus Cetobacterium colombiensis TaxID=3073100 RepID=A0ABU4W759_9FUSO|nr:ribosome maturation factor RimM [Candidatus Cetobacterium colombiensis]MDX8335358.1 ribosome maturation factor RimM [Candidatus Cetobacterium colombiensis]
MELLSVGRVSGTHHLKGAIKVTSNIDDLEILNGNKVMVELSSGEIKILTIKKVAHMIDKKWIVEFEELTNKTDAGTIQNAVIKVRRDILGIEEDEFLANDVIGMKAITESGENIGEVVDIYETAAHDIYVIEDEEFETMIPDVEVFIKKIDFNKREMIVSLIEGMREKKKD